MVRTVQNAGARVRGGFGQAGKQSGVRETGRGRKRGCRRQVRHYVHSQYHSLQKGTAGGESSRLHSRGNAERFYRKESLTRGGAFCPISGEKHFFYKNTAKNRNDTKSGKLSFSAFPSLTIRIGRGIMA